MYSNNCISRLYCDYPKSSNTRISISFDYREMKNVVGLIKHLARNPGFWAYFFLEVLKILENN